MIPETSLWPIGDTNWAYHDWDADIGNKGLDQYVDAVNHRCGTANGIDDFCRKAQLLNYETFRAIFEAGNSKLWNDCGGVLLWMSHQAWPSTIWQTFDHSFEPGGAFFGCKKACEPIHIQWNYDDAKIRLINNTSNALDNLTAEVQVFNLDGTLKYETNFTGLSMPSNCEIQCGSILGGNNLALGRPAVASSSVNANVASRAFDGDGSTRWESQYSDPQWIYIDLGSVKSVDTVELRWEGAYGKAYHLQVSNDASSWNDVFSTTTSDGGYDLITFPATPARYVRMYGTQRGTGWGYSLLDFNVYESGTYLNGIAGLSSVHFLRLKLKDDAGGLLSENFYWRGSNPLSYTAMNTVPKVNPLAYSSSISDGIITRIGVTLKNSNEGILAAARLKLVRKNSRQRVLPTFYDDNYFFLMPNETKVVTLEFATAGLAGEMPQLMLEGWNLAPMEIPIGSGPNLALNKTVSASSTENSSFTAENVLDGNGATRWSSAYSDPQAITIDLGLLQGINRVRLKWETAYARSYQIRVSPDGNSWIPVFNTANGDGGLNEIAFAPVNARYVQMNGTERGTMFGYSLCEFEVYGPTYKLSCQPEDPSHLKLSWDSVPQQTYFVQSAADLSTSNWIQLGGAIQAKGVRTEKALSINDAPQQFFRVKAEF